MKRRYGSYLVVSSLVRGVSVEKSYGKRRIRKTAIGENMLSCSDNAQEAWLGTQVPKSLSCESWSHCCGCTSSRGRIEKEPLRPNHTAQLYRVPKPQSWERPAVLQEPLLPGYLLTSPQRLPCLRISQGVFLLPFFRRTASCYHSGGKVKPKEGKGRKGSFLLPRTGGLSLPRLFFDWHVVFPRGWLHLISVAAKRKR